MAYQFRRVPREILERAVRKYHILRTENGQKSGEAWQGAFGYAIGGEIREERTGNQADVVCDDTAWQNKVVCRFGMSYDPIPLIHARISPTGDRTVAGVVPTWNDRVRSTKNRYNGDLREMVLIDRGLIDGIYHFTTFELSLDEIIEDIRWSGPECRNSRSKGVYHGYNIAGQEILRWQVSGGQLTIITSIPEDRYDFRMYPRRPVAVVTYQSNMISPFHIDDSENHKVTRRFDDGTEEIVFKGALYTEG